MTNLARTAVALATVVLAGSFAVACAPDDVSGTDVQASRSSTPSTSASNDTASSTPAAANGATSTSNKPAGATNAPAPKNADTDGTSTTQTVAQTPAPAAPACNTDTDSVTHSYNIALLRAPDAAGLQYYLVQLQSGSLTRLGVLQAFVTSPEYVNLRANLDSDQFITGLYTGLLGRQPDADGFAYWQGQLASGLARNDVALSFVNSTEFANPGMNDATACYF